MNTRHASRWFWTVLAVVCLTVPFFANKAAANKAATQSQGATANVKTAGGLTVVTFTANPGTITVNLPDDMRAGDTILGTVIAEPNGQTDEERKKNLSGKGTITSKGCIFTLEHNAPDRRVMSRIDQCTNTGSASVQTVSPKVKFTITDRNTTDNTCAVQ